MSKLRFYPKTFYFSQLACIFIFIIAIFTIENQNAINSLILVCCAVLIINFISFESQDALNPCGLLPIMFTFYGIGPLTGDVEITQRFDLEVLYQYIFLQVIGLIAMIIGLNFASNSKHIKNNKILINELSLSSLQLTAIVFSVLSCASVVTQLSAFGGLGGLLRVGYGGERYQVLESSYILGAGFDWVLVSAILFWFYGIKRKSKINQVLGVTIYILCSCIIFFIGGRSSFVYSIIFGSILYHYGHKRISKKYISFGLLLGLFISQFYAIGRYYLQFGAIDFFLSTFEQVSRDPSILLPSNIREFKDPANSMLEVLQFGGPPLQYGSSYLSAFGRLFPFLARLFTDIGFDPNEWRMTTFYPDAWARGEGRGFSPITEGYINFSVFGVFLHLFVYSWILGKIYKNMMNSNTMGSLLFFAGSLPVFMLDGLRIHTVSFLYKLSRVYLTPLIIFYFLLYILGIIKFHK
ncbi:O-antigen polymerase [Mastigocoleus testarum]|uniref:Oligosaccharide repeat unit polymerase n=1 Tax=Mastigocoleus testarum BC008 TaxID=371196 RepID=A0A0V7ZNQ6_9CYAN|nr:O-antigen polymerase [Mastigocoleus testarum]KST66010.1 hypothetical protein BC008_23840 [Mastigocoleus testarum BC008]